MNTWTRRLLVCASVATALTVRPAASETITLRSGNGAAGGPDSQITFLPGPADSEFGAPLTPAQFAAAQAGSPATILPWLNGSWTWTLPADNLAQWLSEDAWGASSGSTNLYALPFTVSSASVGSATLDFHFLCDNWVGEVYTGVNEGLFINGTPISGTTGGNYANQTSWLGLDVTALVNPGPNTLYVLSSDVGGPGGLIFSSTLTVNEGGVVAADEGVASFRLGEAYPNPFNPTTTLPFELAETGQARLVVHDLAGREVAVLFSGLAARGAHHVTFDAGALPSGLYLATLATEAGSVTRKLLLAK